MSFLDWFRPSPALIDAVPATTQHGLVSPWADSSHLEKIVVAELFDQTALPITRELAMSVPSIVKARALICGTLSRFPLKHLSDGVETEPMPWMIRTDSGDPHQRMLWTLDDLIFKGASLWAAKRSPRGELLDARRIPPHRWSIDAQGYITVDGERVPSEDVILIEGPQDSILTIAKKSIRGALDLEAAWMERVQSPVPLVELHVTDLNSDLTSEEKKELANSWEVQRRKGGTAVTPYEIELRTHGDKATDLFIEGRNAVRLDVANFLNIPSSLLEGSQSTASLTYSTTEGKRNELVDYSLRYWAGAVEARLSQDDIVPRGHAIQFDLEWLEQRESEPPIRQD